MWVAVLVVFIASMSSYLSAFYVGRREWRRGYVVGCDEGYRAGLCDIPLSAGGEPPRTRHVYNILDERNGGAS